MTTQDTHHEHGDVDTHVAEHSVASEQVASPPPTPSETNEAANTTGQDATSSEASLHPASNVVDEEQDSSETQASTEDASAPHVEGTQAEVAPLQKQEEVSPAEATTGIAAPATPTMLTETAATVAQEESSPVDSEPAVTETSTQSSEQGEELQETFGASSPIQQEQMQTESATTVQNPDEVQVAGEENSPGQVLEPQAVSSFSAEQVQSVEEKSSTSYTDISPIIDARTEEVRPFTEFIEEFRQAEAARLQAVLREPEIESLALLNVSAAPVVSPENLAEKPPVPFSVEEQESHVASAEAQALTPPSAQTPSEPLPTPEGNELVPPKLSQPRPVSPLLRPASRLRVPRHSRQTREEQATANAAREKAGTPTDATPPTSSDVAAEVRTEQPSPKPTRRYRFDRPATTTNGSTSGAAASSTTAQKPSNGNSASLVPSAQNSEETHTASSSPAQFRAAEGVQAGEQNETEVLKKQKQEQTGQAGQAAYDSNGGGVQETGQASVLTGAPTVVSSSATGAEQGRRRHGQKEQPASVTQNGNGNATVTQAPIQPVETSAPAATGNGGTATTEENVAPEDLPPLEYAELQKANSRRRRRHRSGTSSSAASAPLASSGTAAPATPLAAIPPIQQAAPVPSPQPQPQAAAPHTPAAPVNPLQSATAASSAYTIVSGYTLNQMNQGNELSGPFMGPDPSPARGSTMGRDTRGSRADIQRGVTSAPSYPGRNGDNGFSTASMTQFANIVSQAIQTQTDRMVAELRRTSQTPTSVSVSLPPFPSTERVGVFVDVANLLYSARTLRIGVDFGKLLDFLRGNRRLIRAHAYCPTSPQPGDEQMFLQAVKGLGYRITTKNYKTFSSGAKKADLDLDLCMDVVRLVDGKSVDCIVLVSGDSDFMPMLDYCSDHGVRVEVAAFDEAMSATLRQSCDLFINLSMLDEIRA